MANTNPAIAGLLLSGGESSRFGAPKANALLGGRSLASIALNRLAKTCGAIAIAGPDSEASSNLQLLPDAPDLPRGPLTGILSGLEWAQSINARWLIVSPCDMPLLPPSMHHALLETAEATSAPLAMIAGHDGANPLCSVWSPELARTVRTRLSAEHPAIWRFAEELGAASLHLDDPVMTLNVNTREDLQRAEELTDRHWWNAP